jgi:hypothetical protein
MSKSRRPSSVGQVETPKMQGLLAIFEQLPTNARVRADATRPNPATDLAFLEIAELARL